jgi:hypothetical protein
MEPNTVEDSTLVGEHGFEQILATVETSLLGLQVPIERLADECSTDGMI